MHPIFNRDATGTLCLFDCGGLLLLFLLDHLLRITCACLQRPSSLLMGWGRGCRLARSGEEPSLAGRMFLFVFLPEGGQVFPAWMHASLFFWGLYRGCLLLPGCVQARAVWVLFPRTVFFSCLNACGVYFSLPERVCVLACSASGWILRERSQVWWTGVFLVVA